MKRWSLGWWIIFISTAAMVCCVYSVIYHMYQLQGKAIILRLLAIIGAGALTYIVLIIVWFFIYRKKEKKFMALLNEGKIEEYIAAVERELEKVDEGTWYNIWKMNLSVGYGKLKQREKALSILEDVSCKRFRPEDKAVYALDLFCNYYELDQKEKAMEVYDANEKYLARVRKDTKYSGNIAIIDMYAAIEKGQYEGLEEKLRKTRDTWHNPAFQEDFEKIEELLLRQNA